MINTYEKKAMDEALNIVLSRKRGINTIKQAVIPHLIQYYIKTEEYENCEKLKLIAARLEKQNETKSKSIKV